MCGLTDFYLVCFFPFPPLRYNLAISAGVEGARLTHDHQRHFNFVLQSLSLWQEVGRV